MRFFFLSFWRVLGELIGHFFWICNRYSDFVAKVYIERLRLEILGKRENRNEFCSQSVQFIQNFSTKKIKKYE